MPLRMRPKPPKLDPKASAAQHAVCRLQNGNPSRMWRVQHVLEDAIREALGNVDVEIIIRGRKKVDHSKPLSILLTAK